jgi:hypothetical protein
MRSALYFPHTTIDDQSIVKTALLLWDKIEFITPCEEYRPYYANPVIERAMEIVGAARVPTELEKKEAHGHVEELLDRLLPPQFYVPKNPIQADYEIYPQKFLLKTWEMLSRSRMVGAVQSNEDYPLSETAGLTLMSILADCCAGTTRCRVTDRGAAYATLSGLIGDDLQSVRGDPRPATQQQIVAVALDVIDVQSLDLNTLIAFREREAKEGGSW